MMISLPLFSRLPEGLPDMSCCLFHQKLQMLNSCIRHKTSQLQATPPGHTPAHRITPNRTRSHSRDSTPKRAALTHSSSTSQSYSHSKDPISNPTSSKMSRTPSGRNHTPSDDDDEFFEALETQEDADGWGDWGEDSWASPLGDKSTTAEPSPPSVDSRTLEPSPPPVDSRTLEPELKSQERLGALEQYKDLILIATGEPLYIPTTQVRSVGVAKINGCG